MIFLLLAGLAFLFPIATYCLFLAVVNAREHPTMISGPWDFLGALFATSGFLLIGGPLIISLLHSQSGEALARGRLAGTASDWWALWLVVWIAYFSSLIAGALYFLRRRRACTVIYNIDPPLLDEALNHVLRTMELGASRSGNRIIIRHVAAEPATVSAAITSSVENGHGRRLLPGETIDLEIDPFPSVCNITLHWGAASSPLRKDIEAELATLFRAASIPDNPAAGWFLTVSTCLFGAIFLGLLAFIMFQIRRW